MNPVSAWAATPLLCCFALLQRFGFRGARRLQFAVYLLVGGISFWVDIGTFLIFRRLQMPVLAASAASFIVATLANYGLCRAMVFRGGRFSRTEEIARLFCVASVGLGLNSAVVWCLAVQLGVDPTLSKVLAVLPVLAWNYWGRRLLVFDAAMAQSIADFAAGVGPSSSATASRRHVRTGTTDK